ncbi:MAG: type II toxin-antitoxin system RelE/ParE family toxin [Acidobacteriota bacterium]
MRLSLRFSPRANREIRAASRWWDENRPAAPEAFREAITKAFDVIASRPESGALATNVQLPRVRRLHIHRVHYYLYYRIKANRTFVEILSLWHTSRDTDLKL